MSVHEDMRFVCEIFFLENMETMDWGFLFPFLSVAIRVFGVGNLLFISMNFNSERVE